MRREYCTCRTHPDPPCPYCERDDRPSDDSDAPVVEYRRWSTNAFRAELLPADENETGL